MGRKTVERARQGARLSRARGDDVEIKTVEISRGKRNVEFMIEDISLN